MSSAAVRVINKEYSDSNIVSVIQKSADLWVDFSDAATITTSATNPDRKILTGVTDKSATPKTITVTGTCYYEDSGRSLFTNNSSASYISSTGYTGPSAASPNETLFVVMSLYNVTGALVTSANTANSRWVVINNRQVQVGIYGAFQASGTTTIPYSTRTLVSVTISNNVASIFVNGKFDGSGTTTISASGTTRIGQADATWFQYGNIFEVIAFQSALPDSQRQAIEYYLMNKWKITNPIASPLSVSGCTLWLDGNDATTITYGAGTAVAQWNDKSGNNYHAVQNTAGNQPTYDSSIKGLTFAAASANFMDTTSPFNRTNEVIFIVYRWTGTGSGTGGANPGLISCPISTNNGRSILLSTGGARGVNVFNSTSVSITGQAAEPTGVPNLVEFRNSINTSNTFAYLISGMGNTAAVTAAGITFSSTAATNRIGGGNNGYYLNGTIHEVVLFNRILTGTERQNIRDSLVNKWSVNVNLSLVSQHPYNTIPPALRYFIPTDITNCSLWLDASDNTSLTLNVSNVVTQWRDKSGNGFNPTTNGSPTLQLAANNNNGILFNNQNIYFGFFPSTAINTSNTLTAFCVASLATSTPTSTASLRILSLGTPDSTNNSNCVAFQRHLSNNSITNNRNNLLVPTLTITPGSLFQSCSVFATTQTDNYINGNLNVSGTHTTKSTFNYSQYVVGASDTVSNYWGGLICEIITYNRNLNRLERQLVEGYLAWKWNLRSSMPTTHPFYNDIPLFPRFDIRKIPSVFWLDASDPNGNGTLPSTGAAVTTWVDKSGNGNNLTQSNASLAPTFNYDGTYPGLLFDGSTDYMTAPSGKITATTFTVIIIFRKTSNTPTNQKVLFDLIKTTGATVRRFSLFSDEGGSPFNYLAYSATNEGSNFFKSATVAGGTNRAILSSTENAVNSTATFAWTNGTAMTTVNNPGGSYAVGDPNGFVLGAFTFLSSPVSYSRYHLGYIHEVFVFTPLNIVERQQVEGYLAWKWGVQGNLPSSHPYSKYPPY